MYTIRVHYDNGDSITTRINGTVSDIVNYYLDKPYFFERPGKKQETKAVARCIEFLDVRPARRCGNDVERLRRVYSLSQAYMQRHDNCWTKFRVTYETDRFCGYDVYDCAYIPGMF